MAELCTRMIILDVFPGTVGPCEDGFYKDKEDFSACQRWTKCALDHIEVLGTRTTDTICLKDTDSVASAGSEHENSEGMSKDTLIGSASTGVSVALFIVISIVIYFKCGSKISGFFKNLKTEDTGNIGTKSESTGLLYEGNLRTHQQTLFPSQNMNDTLEKRDNIHSESDVKIQNSIGNVKQTTTDPIENGETYEKEFPDNNSTCHETVPKDIDESNVIEIRQSAESEQSTPNECEKHVNIHSRHSSRKSNTEKPIARVVPVKQENKTDTSSDIDSAYLPSAPPLDSLVR